MPFDIDIPSQELQALYDALPDVVFFIKDAQGRYTHCNLTLMRRADAIIANLTPFRGPSADAGTVFELGFFAATGKPIYAYSSDRRSFARRTREFFGLGSGSAADSEGLAIEDFDLADNLMLAGAVAAAGGAWVTRKAAPGAEIAAFEAFADCLKAIDKAIAPAAQAAAAG